MLRVHSSGSFEKTKTALQKMASGKIYANLEHYGRAGVDALARSTPRDSGLAAASWGYQVSRTSERVSISWFNTNVEGGVNVAVIVQYGHGTGTGGWVQGRDYINPAMRPIFDQILNDVWRQVTSA